MKKDLGNMLKTQRVWGFEDMQSATEYLAKYLLSYMHMELETLPKEEWDRTLRTWEKICQFAYSLIPKTDQERQELYHKHNFDQMMVGIAEDVRHTLIGALSLGIIKKGDKPQKVIKRALELVIERQELLQAHQLKREILDYMREFFKYI